MPTRCIPMILLGAAFSASCSKSPPPEPVPVWEQAQPDPALEHGRGIWRANCRRCHARGVEGAPRIGDGSAWKGRAEKGLDALVESALTGVQGKAGGEMPARGGNEKLTDEEVRAAVAFMLAALVAPATEARR